MLAKGSAIRQDALNKAKAFDEKHQFTANASAKVVSFDKRVGLTEKFTVGISVVNEKVKYVDQRLHVSDKTMAAILAAERKLNDTGSAVKTSRFWVIFHTKYKYSIVSLALKIILFLIITFRKNFLPSVSLSIRRYCFSIFAESSSLQRNYESGKGISGGYLCRYGVWVGISLLEPSALISQVLG